MKGHGIVNMKQKLVSTMLLGFFFLKIFSRNVCILNLCSTCTCTWKSLESENINVRRSRLLTFTFMSE